MDKQRFKKLVKGVQEMKRHIAGNPVRGAKTTVLPAGRQKRGKRTPFV